MNWKTEPFPGQLFIAFFLSNCFGSKGSADVSTAKALNCFSYGAHFTATISLHAVTKPTVTPHGILWPYKSQRKATTERGKKRRKTQRTGGSEKKRRRGTEKLKKGKKERRTKNQRRGGTSKEKNRKERTGRTTQRAARRIPGGTSTEKNKTENTKTQRNQRGERLERNQKKAEAELKKGALTTNNLTSSSVSVTNDSV